MEDTMRDLLSKLDAILAETSLDDIKNHPEADDPRIQKAIADKEQEEGDGDNQEESLTPAIGDEFGISFSEDLEISTVITDILSDGFVIDLDEIAIEHLQQNGISFLEGEIVEGEQHGNSKIYDKCWKGYKKVPGKARGEKGSCEKISDGLDMNLLKAAQGAMKSVKKDPESDRNIKKPYGYRDDGDKNPGIPKSADGFGKSRYKVSSILDKDLDEAEYQGRKVSLGKPMQGDVKKFKVYVKNPQGNVVKVNFGDPNMKIKKSNPARRKSFRARHNCDNPGPRHKARYWSCRAW